MQRLPVTPLPSMTWPSTSISTGLTPKNGSVAEPGLSGVMPGSGVIMMPPVSVCHQVSTTQQRFLPTLSQYHFQVSGLIGSPTVPSTRSDSRDECFRNSSPSRAMARMAVGAV